MLKIVGCTYRGRTLQDAIRWAVRQRNAATLREDMGTAQFWQDELDTLRSRVPTRLVTQ